MLMPRFSLSNSFRLNRAIFAVPFCVLAVLVSNVTASAQDDSSDLLPGTKRLVWEDDIASRMIDGVDSYLLKLTEQAADERSQYWESLFAEGTDVDATLSAKRERLARKLGLRDERVPFDRPEVIAEIGKPTWLAQSSDLTITEIRWPCVGDLHGEGLVITPRHKSPVGTVIVIADADVAPESIAMGWNKSEHTRSIAAELAANGFQVIVPALVDRTMERRRNRANLTRREFIYRSAFEMGRHLIGYEIQQTLALVDWLKKESPETPIAVLGSHEGGRVALYSAAVDPRIDVVAVSGYFKSRQDLWQEPIDRNVFGLLGEFGDAELAALIAPRPLLIESARGPQVELPSEGGGPGTISSVSTDDCKAEFERAEKLLDDCGLTSAMKFIKSGDGRGPAGSLLLLNAVADHLGAKPLAVSFDASSLELTREIDAEGRQRRLVSEMDRHNQQLLIESGYVRQEFMKDLNTDSLEAFEASQAPYRELFAEAAIGTIHERRILPEVRSRKAYDEEKWTGYEVVLDVYEGVFAYGILLVPKGIEDGEKRPVVVCQHGLEGRPQDVVAGDHRAYHDFAAKLAERGFVTFAPQNIYIFGDRFRTLQRKANPIGLTLFSVMVPQHQTIVDWLGTLEFVDRDRIAFYGLSYGGKSAMRIPALVTDYCLSICSADFNEWVWKNASTRSPYSYVWTGEYEIFEFDLGSTYNYAEMAALIAPRPFMVERGHFDGVAPDETVGYEFAKVRHLYAARLGLPERCEIEWFVGPHTINGKGTFRFLHRHLDWPEP